MVLKFRNIDPRNWSPTWIRSKQPRKQRKYIIHAPLHVRRKLMVSTLSKELRELLKTRNLPIKVGDYVKVMRGSWSGKEGYVFYVDTKNYRVYVDSVYFEKKNGEKVYYPIHPSKLMILKLNLTDMKRIDNIIKVKGLDEKTISEIRKKSIINDEDLSKVYELNKSFK